MKIASSIRRKIFLSDHPLPWLLPMFSMLTVFTIYPFFYTLWLSFHEYSIFKRRLQYVGFENWGKLFTDARLWESLGTTAIYFIVVLLCQLILGMLIALLLDCDEKGFAILRGILTLTLVIPPAVTGMMFLLMEDPEFGIFTYFLQSLRLLSKEFPILSTPATALIGVMVADIWQWTPFVVLIFIAGLRSLPAEPYEAAVLDGASATQIFFRITFPMMGKIIAVVTLIRGIDIFRMFDYVFVMTSGGPGTSTYTLSLYIWQQTFSFIKWGYGATLSIVSLVIVLLICNLFIKYAKVKW